MVMDTLLGVDHALASPIGRQAASGAPPRVSTSSEAGNHPNPGPDPANPPPVKGTLPEDSGGGQIE